LMAARIELPKHCKIQNEWRASETIIIKFEAEQELKGLCRVRW
jgi:hypothetical protein